MIKNYGSLSVYSVGLITQILAMFGVSPEFNHGVWVYGVFALQLSLGIVYLLMTSFSYGQVKSNGNSLASLSLVESQIESELLVWMGMEALTFTALTSQWGPWM